MLLVIMPWCMAAELLDMYMGKLEEQLNRSEDTFRNASSLLLLLQHFPGDMDPPFQQDVVTFFANQLPIVNQLRFICLSAALHLAYHAQSALCVTQVKSVVQLGFNSSSSVYNNACSVLMH